MATQQQFPLDPNTPLAPLWMRAVRQRHKDDRESLHAGNAFQRLNHELGGGFRLIIAMRLAVLLQETNPFENIFFGFFAEPIERRETSGAAGFL